MRYATVVVRRFLARLSGDGHAHRPETPAPIAGADLRPEVSGIASDLGRRLVVLLLSLVRFVAVAAPPTTDTTARSGAPAGRRDRAAGVASAGSAAGLSAPASGAAPSGVSPAVGKAAARGVVATAPAPAPARTAPSAAFIAPAPSGRRRGGATASTARSAAALAALIDPSRIRLPGAHPVSPAALAREEERIRRAERAARRRAAAMSAVAWLASVGRHHDTNADTAIAADAEGAPAPSRASWSVGQRLVGAAVAALVLAASIVSVSPVAHLTGGTGNVSGAGVGPRVAIGGGSAGGVSDGGFGGLAGQDGSSGGSQGGASGAGTGTAAVAGTAAGTLDNHVFVANADQAGLQGTDPNMGAQDIEGFSSSPGSAPDGLTVGPTGLPDFLANAPTDGPWLADGTLLKPIAVDTTIPDARTLLTRYTVKRGDTLTSIAHRYGLSLVTLYWANHLTMGLKTKTSLKPGSVLSIPPVNGVLHIVTDNETLQDIAKRTGVSVARIVDANGLDQPTVFVGQWIIIPGARSKPIPVVAPKPRPAVHTQSSSSSSSSSSSTKSSTATSRPAPKPVTRPTRPTYTGGGWVWPVPGGQISQYYHYGHWAIDIADTYGQPVLAAKAGVVIFAGWKNNGGGWQVWISHGNNIYTTYNHMSSLTVGTGQVVSAGHQVGRIGATGDATGPHCHFEVWIGPIWAGGTRVNPLGYV